MDHAAVDGSNPNLLLLYIEVFVETMEGLYS